MDSSANVRVKGAICRVLLVEDNELNRIILSRRLERKQFQVSIAVDGQQALDMVVEERPDLILMDLSLPVMDGLEAIRRLKADEATRDIPIIVLTAHSLKTDRDGAFEAGCDEFDVKPINFPRLLSKFEGLIQTPAQVT